MRNTTHRLSKKDVVFLLSLFVTSRILAALAGVRFNAEPVSGFLQVLDVPLLQARLLESLWYLHIQPPLFNGLLGLVLKSALPLGPAFNTIFLIIGASVLLLVFRLGLLAGLSRNISKIIALIFSLSPGALLYENLLFYPDIVLLGLLLLTNAIGSLEHSRAARWIVGVALLTVCWTWSLFHLAWLGALGVLMLLRNSKGSTLAIGVPIVLTALLYLKNLLLFGVFGATSWLGMNLASMVITPLPVEERQALVSRGVISKNSAKGPFLALSEYPAASPILRGVPALDERTRVSGAPNYNNATYLGISRQFLRDDVAAIGANPVVYLRSIARSLFHFASPTSVHTLNEGNRFQIRTYDRIYSGIVYGAIFSEPRVDAYSPFAYKLRYLLSGALFSFVVLPIAFWTGFQLLRRWRTASSEALVLAVTLVYVCVVGNLIETGENARFKFVVEPFVWILLATTVSRWVRDFTSGKPNGLQVSDLSLR